MLKNDEKQYQSQKILDKIYFCKTRNKIINTDFLDMSDISNIQKLLLEEGYKNYFFEGARENAERKILILYPEKFTEEMARKNIHNILSLIRIKLPKNVKYEHRDFLSGIMKLGLKREKFGDIIVTDEGADIIVLKEVSNYLKNSLQELTRFKKSEICILNIDDVQKLENNFEEFSIIVSSLRLDNFVSELARCSRTKAEEIILEQRVFINSNLIEKNSKKINEGDIITIRGKGKFIFDSIKNKTKSDRIVLNIKKYI